MALICLILNQSDDFSCLAHDAIVVLATYLICVFAYFVNSVEDGVEDGDIFFVHDQDFVIGNRAEHMRDCMVAYIEDLPGG